jgi:hypothetical protein
MSLNLKTLTRKVKKAKPISWYKPGKTVKARDVTYKLSEPYGKVRKGKFQPQLSPPQMLVMGIFEGKYINNDTAEFPKEWYEKALKAGKLSPEKPNVEINYFKTKSRLPRSEWHSYGWIPSTKKVTRKQQYSLLSNQAKNPDSKGWFQWYCRYYCGRRMGEIDEVQMKRWNAFKRHLGQIKANCKPGDLTCRPRQRQSLLQWAYNPTV